MLFNKKLNPLVALVYAAYEHQQKAHKRMKHEWMLYQNEETDSWWTSIMEFANKKSIDAKIPKAIDKMIPAFASELTKVEIQPDKSAQTEMDQMYIDDLQRNLEAHETADSEQSRLETLIYQNRVMGNAVSKVRLNKRTGIVEAPAINPLMFAPDPSAADVDFSNAEYCVQTNYHSDAYVARKFPGARTVGSMSWMGNNAISQHKGVKANNRVDELWMLPDLAAWTEQVRIHKRTRMVTVWIVNNEPYAARSNVLWYPGFPFAVLRTFIRLSMTQTQDFYGDGYATKMEGQQKLFDHLLGQYLYICQNLPVGRIVTTDGTLDTDQVLNVHGANIKLKKNKKINEDFLFIPPGEAPVSLMQAIQAVGMLLDEGAPSLAPVFTGNEPSAQSSGRAIMSLQQASFNQFSSQFQSMNEFRLRRTGMRLHYIQQKGRLPQAPHMWRRGLDLPDELPEDARFVGFNLSIPDSTGIPNTVLGRLQVLQILNGLGYALSPARTIDFLKLDTTYGISEQDLLQPAPVESAGGQMNESAAMELPLAR